MKKRILLMTSTGDTSFALSEEPMPAPLPDQLPPLTLGALRRRPELKGLHLESSAAEKLTRAQHAHNFPSFCIQAAEDRHKTAIERS